MKRNMLGLGLLLASPLAAQSLEVGVFIGQQQYPSPHADVLPGTTLRMEADSKTVYAVRLGYSIVDLGPALFQLTAGFQPEARSTVKASLGGSPSVNVGEFKENHWSAGAMFQFKAVVAVGAGLEFRSERLSGDVSGTSDSTTYNRIWGRLNAGFAIPSPVLQAFFGVEAAFPFGSRSLDPNASNADLLKSLAPRNQIGIYAGLRF